MPFLAHQKLIPGAPGNLSWLKEVDGVFEVYRCS